MNFREIANFYLTNIRWERAFQTVPKPKRDGAVVVNQKLQEQIERELRNQDLIVFDYHIDQKRFDSFRESAHYGQFADYYRGAQDSNSLEKQLEHFIATDLLEIARDDVYIDIASCNSPIPEIYKNMFGCEVYLQDLEYPEGLHDHTIGGDAAAMPVPADFASKMGLHCSFEHFEGTADVRFIDEIARVLRPGGRCCIVPLYLSDQYSIQTDLSCIPLGELPFEADAITCCAKGWRNRHGRFYDILHLKQRILGPAKKNNLKVSIYSIKNTEDVDPSCYARFAMVIEKGA